jgi:hypothetical protein
MICFIFGAMMQVKNNPKKEERRRKETAEPQKVAS